MSLVEWLPISRFDAVPLKAAYDLKIGRMLQTSPLPGDVEAPYLKAGHVSWDGVVTEDLPTMWASAKDLTQYAVRPGDLLVCEGGEVGRAALYPDAPPVILQNSLHRIRSKSGNNLQYLAYVLETAASLGWFDVLCNRATIRHLTAEKLGALLIPLPTPEIQARTVAWLASRLADLKDIDGRRAEQLRAISLRRDAVLHRMFEAAAMSSDLLPLRRVMARWIDYRGSTPEKAPQGVPLVTARNIKDGAIRTELSAEFVAAADYADWMRRGMPQTGDVLLTTEAPLGEVAQVEDPNIALAQRVILLRPERVRGRWLYWYLRSPQGQAELRCRATGSTALGIKADRLREVPIPVPPLAEQDRLLAEIERQMSAVDELVRPVASQRALLAVRRVSLLSAAIAGSAVSEAA